MKLFKPWEKLVATHTVLFGLLVLAILPQDEPQNTATLLGESIYILIVLVALGFVIRAWIDYNDYKRKLFLRNQSENLLKELREDVHEVFYLGTEDEPYDWAKEVHDPWAEEDPFRDEEEPSDK